MQAITAEWVPKPKQEGEMWGQIAQAITVPNTFSLGSNPADADIDVRCKELERHWKNYLQSLESEQEEEKKKKSKFWKSDGMTRWKAIGGDRPVTFDYIVATVSDAEKLWKDKDRLARGKAQRIAEGLAKALVEISDELDICVDTVHLMDVADMRQAIGNLYSHIFHFLQCAMQWFQSKSWKKVLNSFTEDFYDVFEDQIVKIKKLSSRILSKGAFKSQAEVRDLRLYIMEDAKQKAKEKADHQSRNSAAMDQKFSELKDFLGQLVGQNITVA
ncbi:MAG: hypothetical protein Q9187_005025 [Circinaria calcarea]